MKPSQVKPGDHIQLDCYKNTYEIIVSSYQKPDPNDPDKRNHRIGSIYSEYFRSHVNRGEWIPRGLFVAPTNIVKLPPLTEDPSKK